MSTIGSDSAYPNTNDAERDEMALWVESELDQVEQAGTAGGRGRQRVRRGR